jgi:hypothetical protein
MLAHLANPGTAAAKEPPRAEVLAEDGLLTARFQLPEGVVRLRLPGDLAVGETVSGTLSLEVAGLGAKKRDKNARRLAEMSLVVGGARGRVEVSEIGPLAVCGSLAGPAETALPVGCDRGGLGGPLVIPVLLEDAKGRPLAEARVPVAVSPESGGLGTTYLPVALAGQPLVIHGGFDGRFATTRVTLGGSEVRRLAESPHRLVVESPPTEVGETLLVLEELGGRLEGPLRNLTVFLEISKPLLEPEERTILRLQLHGLADLEAPLPLTLVARPAGVVRFERGTREQLLIDPAEPQAGGVYPWIGTLVGIRTAPFHIVVEPGAEIRPRRLEPPASPGRSEGTPQDPPSAQPEDAGSRP